MHHHEKRDRARIYAEILALILRQTSAGQKPTLTGIQTRVNVPFVRFKEYFEDLKEKGLFVTEPDIIITDAGRRYLAEYEKVREFLEKFGLVRKEG